MRQQFFLAYKGVVTSTGLFQPPLNTNRAIYTKQMPNHLQSEYYLFSSVKPLLMICRHIICLLIQSRLWVSRKGYGLLTDCVPCPHVGAVGRTIGFDE